jgi:ATP-binding protein involved in chromosome partitioning
MPFFRKRITQIEKAPDTPDELPAEPVAAPRPPVAPKRALPIAGAGAPPRGLPVAHGAPGKTPRPLPMMSGPLPAGARPVTVTAPGSTSAPAPEKPGTPFEEAVKRAVATVQDPDLGRPLVELGMVKSLTFQGQVVRITVELAYYGTRYRQRVEHALREAIATVPEVVRVEATFTAQVRAANSANRPGLAGVKNTIAIASGKGGVGKSTVTVNLAVALAQDGAKVGLLDADVYGPSMPLMLDLQGQQPRVRTIPAPVPGERPTQKLQPLEAFGIKVMSIGFLVEAEKPVIWRGPMASQLINQFINDVEWDDLDYLLIDLPPGTGDIHLTLTQRLPLSGAIIVTTPQDVALSDAIKGLQMFKEVQVPILGLVENMSYFVCPACGEKTAIFGEGGGSWAAERYDVPLLGQIPLALAIREGGDAGRPIVIAAPDSPQAQAFHDAAQAAAARLALEASLTQGRRPAGPLIQIQRRKPGE